MGAYQLAKKVTVTPNEDARPSKRRDHAEIAADYIANVSIDEYKGPPRLGVPSMKHSVKLKMSEVDLMTSRAFADGQMAATFRMRTGRDNPEQLQSFLQSRIAGPSGGAAPEQAEAGAAGGGGEENAATISTSPASSEGVLLKPAALVGASPETRPKGTAHRRYLCSEP